MSGTQFTNLDRVAAVYSQGLVRKATDAGELEQLSTRALDVLQEQGVFACMLYLESQGAKDVSAGLWGALRALPIQQPPEGGKGQGEVDRLSFYAKDLGGRFDDLMLVRDVYERLLIYTRFGAKAKGKRKCKDKGNVGAA